MPHTLNHVPPISIVKFHSSSHVYRFFTSVFLSSSLVTSFFNVVILMFSYFTLVTLFPTDSLLLPFWLSLHFFLGTLFTLFLGSPFSSITLQFYLPCILLFSFLTSLTIHFFVYFYCSLVIMSYISPSLNQFLFTFLYLFLLEFFFSHVLFRRYTYPHDLCFVFTFQMIYFFTTEVSSLVLSFYFFFIWTVIMHLAFTFSSYFLFFINLLTLFLYFLFLLYLLGVFFTLLIHLPLTHYHHPPLPVHCRRMPFPTSFHLYLINESAVHNLAATNALVSSLHMVLFLPYLFLQFLGYPFVTLFAFLVTVTHNIALPSKFFIIVGLSLTFVLLSMLLASYLSM